MLTSYDFSVITGLRLGSKRILVNDSLTSTELNKILGVMPSRMRKNNIPLFWLCENIQSSIGHAASVVYSCFFLLGLSCVRI